VEPGLRGAHDGGGPPLCVLDGFAYVSAEHALEVGGIACVVSDGVTEAMNAAGQLYGVERLEAALRRSRQADGPQALVDAIKADVALFVGGAEVADDLTLLVLRWNGSTGR
jgi:serine phosphatase RsbU (regulator of sigma subunit)